MEYNKIKLEKKGEVMVLTMNNPEKMNALCGETIRELSDAADLVEFDEEVRIVIVTGNGKAFVAGADISYMKEMSPFEAISYARETTRVYEKIESSKKIYIGAINGYALGGGCEFALSLDIILASEKARFALPEASLGILPGGGGTQRLSRLVGRKKALELMITCRRITAEEAVILGMVNAVTQAEALMDEAMAMANSILTNAPKSVSLIKECVRMSGDCSLAEGMEFEKNVFGLCFSTDDQKEGFAAFSERREAVYHNR